MQNVHLTALPVGKDIPDYYGRNEPAAVEWPQRAQTQAQANREIKPCRTGR